MSLFVPAHDGVLQIQSYDPVHAVFYMGNMVQSAKQHGQKGVSTTKKKSYLSVQKNKKDYYFLFACAVYVDKSFFTFTGINEQAPTYFVNLIQPHLLSQSEVI